MNLRLKGVSGKLRRKYNGPFRVIEEISTQSYGLKSPQEWEFHSVFHVSLLKKWNESGYVPHPSDFDADEFNVPADTMREVD